MQKYGGATFETGRLRYGCGDPASAAYDSLADFMTREGCIELRLPWQLLNFADPLKCRYWTTITTAITALSISI